MHMKEQSRNQETGPMQESGRCRLRSFHLAVNLLALASLYVAVSLAAVGCASAPISRTPLLSVHGLPGKTENITVDLTAQLEGRWRERYSKTELRVHRDPSLPARLIFDWALVGSSNIYVTTHANVETVGSDLLLDFIAPRGDSLGAEDGLYSYHYLPVHSFAVATRRRQFMNLYFLRADWVSQHLLIQPDALDHLRSPDGSVILTAPPDAIRNFILLHRQTRNALTPPQRFRSVTIRD